MRKTLIILALSCLLTGQATAGIPVSIIANAQGALEHIDRIRNYIEVAQDMKKQFDEAKRTTKALSGVRNIGDLFQNPVLLKYFPDEFHKAYYALRAEGYEGLTQSGALSYALNQVYDNCKRIKIKDQRMICESDAAKPSQDQAMATDLYMKTLDHQTAIEEMRKAISQTEDMKEITDLNGRIAAENTQIANLANQMEAANQMNSAQERVDRQVHIEENGKWFQSENKLQLKIMGQ